MPEEIPWYETASIPALLRHARATYGRAMRQTLEEAGFDDIPANGLYVLGALALTEAPLSRIIEDLGASKQAAGYLVDALVLRGYIERKVDETDRRRLNVSLTERGKSAAEAQAKGRERIDAALLARVGPEHVTHARATLAALIGIGKAEISQQS
jgi:DNA-binding MarR family transcriptional regulator